MLSHHADIMAGSSGSVLWCCSSCEIPIPNPFIWDVQPLNIVVDSGTGTIRARSCMFWVCSDLPLNIFRLPWKVTTVMLADTIKVYKQQEKGLISDFKELFGLKYDDRMLNEVDGIVHWVERVHPRKFGNVLGGEVEACQKIAPETGILVDPICTLAAWEHAMHLCERKAEGDAKVVMIHTGGTLSMFGLAQRYKSFFHTLKGTVA